MSRPINLYMLSRIQDEDLFKMYLYHETYKSNINDNKIQIRDREIQSLRILVDILMGNGIDIEGLDNFYYNFEIPQIGKEFDLLKISENIVLNIELKSEDVADEKIEKQLKKNMHYLKHFSKEIKVFCLETKNRICYTLRDSKLYKTAIQEIVDCIKNMGKSENGDIEEHFRVSDYLVSPLNTPQKFIDGDYFLTLQQEECKKDILNKLEENGGGFFYITGKPGTGKTLLLYDIAKELAKKAPTLVIHCGICSGNQLYLNGKIENFDVVDIKNAQLNFFKYKFIFIDESHRLYLNQFDIICKIILRSGSKYCFFSGDPGQMLSKSEIGRDIIGKISKLPLLGNYNITNRIRTNEEIATFIKYVLNLNQKPIKKILFPNISVAFAKNVIEANIIIKHYQSLGYYFINYTKSNYKNGSFDKYFGNDNTHRVIGQEFDKVIMVMNYTFFYDDNKRLVATEHPNPDYLYGRLFYQGATRVREKFALVIVGDVDLFDKITAIFR